MSTISSASLSAKCYLRLPQTITNTQECSLPGTTESHRISTLLHLVALSMARVHKFNNIAKMVLKWPKYMYVAAADYVASAKQEFKYNYESRQITVTMQCHKQVHSTYCFFVSHKLFQVVTLNILKTDDEKQTNH